jgi:serine phosphatase RsbU (regulator of sigma subunit)
MHPARELGGDFYDVFQLPDGRCGVLVADVSGKGAAAAFFMAVSRTVLLDLAMSGLSPAGVLARANDLLCRHNPMDMFVTVCCGVYDPRDGGLVYACAGHPAPLLRRADASVSALPCDQDLALAILPDMDYAERRTRLDPGDTLLLYTDGVTEAFSGETVAYGDERLQAWFARDGAGTGRPGAGPGG